MFRPSGESAETPREPVVGSMANRTASTGGARRGTSRERNAAAAAATTTAAIHARRSRLFRRLTTTAGRSACEPACAIHCSSLLTSCALCHRSSGSLARHVRTRRSSDDGVIGARVEIGAGSADMIAVMREAREAPENAFFPVAIS
jgi:hypothetical protein